MTRSLYILYLLRVIYLALIYSVLRLGFYLYHIKIYHQFSLDEIFISFLMGIRFDIAAIALLSLPFAFLSPIKFYNRTFFKFESFSFCFIHFLGFLVSLNDFELFLFLGKRLSIDFFSIAGDALNQTPQLILYYWYLPVVSILIGVLLFYFEMLSFKSTIKNYTFKSHLLFSFSLLVLFFVAIRGGFQSKSINIQSAFTQGKNELGHLVLNSPYAFMRTLNNSKVKKIKYFSDDLEAKRIILSKRNILPSNKLERKSNVVLIVFESLSLEYMEKGYTPFLNSLASQSLFSKRHLANGRRSIESLPSLLCGLPALIDDPISKSIFSSNQFTCLPDQLKKSGYTNYFYHGGGRGTMGFDSYVLSHGVDKYFSSLEYPNQNDHDGTWGIYDGPYLKYVAREISQIKQPFFSGIFTLSSHQPYSIPKHLKGVFPKGSLEIHESIGYTDSALKDFFQMIQKSGWFKNTLFIITSDHTQKLESKKFQNLIGHYRVPLILYHHDLSPNQILKTTQHSDIPASILDFLGLESKLPLTSVSLFSSGSGVALNYAEGLTYFLVQNDQVSTLNKSNMSSHFIYDWDTGTLVEQTPGDELLLKAYLQYFINGLITNKLSQ